MMRRVLAFALVLGATSLLVLPALAWGAKGAKTPPETTAVPETKAPADAKAVDARSAPGGPAKSVIPETAAPGTESRVQNVIQWFKSGGWVMWVLLFFSILGLAVTLERVVMLQRARFAPRGLTQRVKRLWLDGNYDGVLAEAETSRSVMGRVVAFMVEHRDARMEEVSTGAGDLASAEHRRAMSRFSLLSTITMASPLVGLLGTVGAMIESFRNVVNAGKLGSAATLYQSISTALVTTEAGLMVAIPALILYHYFRSRTNGFAAQVDEEATDLINSLYISSSAKRLAPRVAAGAAV